MFGARNAFLTASVVFPVVFSAVGVGASDQSSFPFTFNHVAAAGDDVLVYVGVDRNSTVSVTYGGVAMRRLGLCRFSGAAGDNEAVLVVFTAFGVSAGTNVVSVTGTSLWCSGQAVSYANVAHFGIPQLTSGTGTSTTQAVTPPASGLVSQVFGASVNFSATTGGTNRAFRNGSSTLAINDAATAVTVGNTLASSVAWAAIAVPMYPTVPTGIRYTDYGGMTAASNGSAPPSFTINTAIGDHVFVDVMVDRPGSVTAVTCGGSSMTLVDSQTFTGVGGNGTVYRWKIGPLGSGGSQTIAFTASASGAWWMTGGVSLAGITTVGTTTKTFNNSSTPSQAVTCSTGEVILQTIASPTPMLRPTGGVLVFDSNMLNAACLGISLAQASTTFAWINTSIVWAALATVLTP